MVPPCCFFSGIHHGNKKSDNTIIKQYLFISRINKCVHTHTHRNINHRIRELNGDYQGLIVPGGGAGWGDVGQRMKR
jgi:hypothetical protein